MLTAVQQLDYTIVLCEDMDVMKSFYRNLFPFAIESESETTLAMRAGSLLLALRKRTRDYDGHGSGPASPGVQLAFRVPLEDVGLCHRELVAEGITILDPPRDQIWGHRTVYFSDPEGNILEVYGDLDP